MHDRDLFIKAVKAALKTRSSYPWSVTGGRGTAWGWVEINVAPRDRKFNSDGSEGGGHMSPARRAELAALLGLDQVHFQGVSIPSGGKYRAEYLARARGEEPAEIAQPYWD